MLYKHQMSYVQKNKRMNLRILLLTLTLLLFFQSHANHNTDKEDIRPHFTSASAELFSVDTWKLEASYHWFPIKYIGIGGGLGVWKQYTENGVPCTKEWSVDDNSNKMCNVYLMPSLLLKSPSFVKSESVQLGLMNETGFMMNIPYRKVEVEKRTSFNKFVYDEVSCHKGRWHAFNVRTGVYLNIDAFSIFLGYVFSNLDIYGMHRNMQYQGVQFNQFYPKRKNTNGAFMMIGYSF